MSEPKKVGRRTFLNYAIAVVATGVIVGAATYFAVPKGEVTVTAPGTTVTKTVTTTVTGTQTTTSPTTSLTTTTSSLKPGEITFWFPSKGPPWRQGLERVANEFMQEHPGVKINLQEWSWDSFREKVKTIFTMGGPGPDLIWSKPSMSIMYKDMKYGIIPLDDLIQRDFTPLNKYFPEYVMNAWKLDSDNIWGLPIGAGVAVFEYNSRLFEDAGISPNITYWDEVEEIVKTLTIPEKNQYGCVFSPREACFEQIPTRMYQQYIGLVEGTENWVNYRDSLKKAITFDVPGTVKILEDYYAWGKYAPEGPKGCVGLSNDDQATLMAKGNVGMMLAGWSDNANLVLPKNPAMEGVLKFMVLPRERKGRGGVQVSAKGFNITKQAVERGVVDICWEFIKACSDREAEIAPPAFLVPFRLDVKITPEIRALFGGLSGQAIDIYREYGAFADPTFPLLVDWVTFMAEEMEAMLLGKKTAAEAVHNAAERLKKEMSA